MWMPAMGEAAHSKYLYKQRQIFAILPTQSIHFEWNGRTKRKKKTESSKNGRRQFYLLFFVHL